MLAIRCLPDEKVTAYHRIANALWNGYIQQDTEKRHANKHCQPTRTAGIYTSVQLKEDFLQT